MLYVDWANGQFHERLASIIAVTACHHAERFLNYAKNTAVDKLH